MAPSNRKFKLTFIQRRNKCKESGQVRKRAILHLTKVPRKVVGEPLESAESETQGWDFVAW